MNSVVESLARARRKLATAGIGLLAMALAWHVIFGANGMLIYHQKRSEYKQLQIEIDALQKENQQLQQSVEKLRSDPKAIEREAREQLRYARPGEVIYTLPSPPPARPPANLSAAKH